MVVNAGVDSMGGVIDGGVEISFAPSTQQSLHLEKTRAELRDTFTAAEKFRRELEFLQKGGDPLDLKVGYGTSVSLQSTSLFDLHPEQLGTSEVKGSFAITASPHGDSVESSGRLGAPSADEPNSADNLMLFDRENKFHGVEKRSLHLHMNNTISDVALDFPKKSYKRRNRSRSNRDAARSSSTDAGPRSGQPFLASRHASNDSKGVEPNDENQEQKYLSNSNSVSKNPVAHLNLVASNSRLDVKLNGNQTQKSTQPLTSDIRDSVGHVEQETFTKSFESKLSGNQSIPRLDEKNENDLVAKVDFNGTMEHIALNEAPSIEGNNVNTLNGDNLLITASDSPNPCPASHNDTGSTLKECEQLKGSETSLQHVSPMSTKEHEDSILEEAKIIEEKHKRIAGFSVGIFSSESYHKSHWHFILEEMSWLANDFSQERLWKVTAAAQISRRAAYSSWVRCQQQCSLWKQKQVAHTLAQSVMEFWHIVQVQCHELEFEGPKKDTKPALHQYGLRFLEYNSSRAQSCSVQAPMTPDRISDLGTTGISWEDNLTEENLFYTVPPGAIEDYRKSIESHLLQCERTGSSMQEEVDVYVYDAVTATKSQDDILEEDEGETNPDYLPEAFGGSRSSKPTQKKKKYFTSYGQKSYDLGHGSLFMQSHERAIGPQPSILSVKRPSSSINVSIPTKRVRTASRPRFNGPTGFIQAPNRPDASIGDNNSFQDEQSSLHGGSHIPDNIEVESAGEYEKQSNFDLTEVSNRARKKKKIKHSGSMFDHRWQLDSNFQNDQKDHLKRRLDAHQFDSNGNSVASQTSMSNSNKFIKLLVRDRGRKAKSLKTSAGQQGFGSPWSLFEDQALVVLVHDMGANWELVCDAINSILQFKFICRNSKECKERHKLLMDRNNGDGADSGEDSGSSQPYPSTLPGIPEGSARQLFQRLQGPMEENTLKSHFEKIIMIWQKQHYKKAQKDNHDSKQRQLAHSSHELALSQVCPNNLNDGPVLTPLDFCDAISPSPDFVPVGYQGPHSGGLLGPNHGNVAPMVSGSSPASSLPGSSGIGLGSHLASASAPLSPSVREGRHGAPRAGSLSIEDQHRMQHLNQISARNLQQSGLPPGSHSGYRMLQGGTSMGVMNGMNRSMTMARPAFQGIPSPSMLNPGVTPGNVHSGLPGQGNLVRPREAMHMMRPNQNSEHQRQVTAPDGMGNFPTQNNTRTPVQSYPHPMSSQQSPHMPHHLQGPPTHPTYGMRFIKERQLHQQHLLQQQLATSNPVMPHVHSQSQQSQIPVSVSSPQSSTQIESHASPPINQMHQHPPKRAVPPPHGLVRKPQTGVNLMVKQPPRQPTQPIQPPARKHHPQQMDKVINGFSGGQENGDEQQNGQGAVPSKQSTNKKHPGQHRAGSSKQKHFNRQPHPPQKITGKTKETAGQRMIQSRKENASDPSTSKLLAEETAQTSGPFYDSSGPHSNSAADTGGREHSGSAVNLDDVDVQWQKQTSL